MTTPDHSDPGPRPYTDDEWAPLAAALANHPATASVAVAGNTLARLVDTVDTERALRQQAEAELDEWKERAEQSALRSIEARNPGIDMDEVRRLRSGTPGEDTDTPAELLCENCGKPMSDHDAMAQCRHAPAEPVCTTCNDTRRIGTEWDDVGIPCPDCRSVGDQPATCAQCRHPWSTHAEPFGCHADDGDLMCGCLLTAEPEDTVTTREDNR